MLREWGEAPYRSFRSIFTAIQNVAPSQLADRELFDFVSLKTTPKPTETVVKDEKRLEMVNLLL
jgi:tRNA 2-thiocytidine biosynthesis protein TtcA